MTDKIKKILYTSLKILATCVVILISILMGAQLSIALLIGVTAVLLVVLIEELRSYYILSMRINQRVEQLKEWNEAAKNKADELMILVGNIEANQKHQSEAFDEMKKLEEDKIMADEMAKAELIKQQEAMLLLEQDKLMLQKASSVAQIRVQCPCSQRCVQDIDIDMSKQECEYKCDRCNSMVGVKPTFELFKKTEIK